MSFTTDALTRLTGLTLDPAVPITPPSPVAPPEPAPAESADKPTPAAEGADEASPEHTDPEDAAAHEDEQISLRALVNTKEAGALIGKAGRNVAEIRDVTGVKAGVSKVVEGVQERILTVSGGLSQVAKAFNLFSRHLVDTQARVPAATSDKSIVTVRLLVPHQQVGSIIGKGGARIREIQENSGARIVAGKEMLPQSTERVIEIHGFPDSVQIAITGIGESLIQDTARAAGTIYYKPETAGPGGSGRTGGSTSTSTAATGTTATASTPGFDTRRRSEGPGKGLNGSSDGARRRDAGRPEGGRPVRGSQPAGDLQTATLSVPSDLVGCIIGRGGSIINDIRADSGSRISIAKESDPVTGQRTFTIHGTAENNQRALQLIYETLESEKDRRARDDGGRDD